MFFGSDNGGRAGAVPTSLIATPERLRIDPSPYLCEIFERIISHFQIRFAELLPDRWEALRQPAATP